MNDIIVRRPIRRQVARTDYTAAPQPKPAIMSDVAVRTHRSTPRPAPTPSPAPNTARGHQKYARQQPKPAPSKSFPRWLQITLATVLLVAGPVVMQSDVLGQLAIVAYGIIAYIWRIPSRTTFTLALIAITATAIFLVVKGNFAPAGNFATYTFLFLTVGVVSLTREIKKEGGRIYSIRNNKP